MSKFRVIKQEGNEYIIHTKVPGFKAKVVPGPPLSFELVGELPEGRKAKRVWRMAPYWYREGYLKREG